MTAMFESIFISLILISVVSSQISNLDKCKRFGLCKTDADCHGGKCLGNIRYPDMPKFCKCDIPAVTTTTEPPTSTYKTTSLETTTPKIYFDVCIPDKKCDDWPGNCGEAIGLGRCDIEVKTIKKFQNSNEVKNLE